MVRIPFRNKLCPMRRLALINFEKEPDELYGGLELQYLEGEPYGTGWRVLAYRKDGYVDVYDSKTLAYQPEDKVEVAGKGRNGYKHTEIDHVVFNFGEHGIEIGFRFFDIQNREIKVLLKENSKRKTKPMNLLAPIGSGTEQPMYLPIFFLYQFDFLRKGKSKAEVTINGNKIKLDKFPFPSPKEAQWRYYTRYSMDSQIAEFADAYEGIVPAASLNENLCAELNNITYSFQRQEDGLGMKEIIYPDPVHSLKVCFEPAIPEIKPDMKKKECKGMFYIRPETRMGVISGEYEMHAEEEDLYITMVPSGGWDAVPNSLLTRMIFNKKMLFHLWPMSYCYKQRIHLTTMETTSCWKRQSKKA